MDHLNTGPVFKWSTIRIPDVKYVRFSNVSGFRMSGLRILTVQWGSEYQPFEYRKHLNTKLFKFGFQMVRYSNGRSMGHVLHTGPPMQKVTMTVTV